MKGIKRDVSGEMMEEESCTRQTGTRREVKRTEIGHLNPIYSARRAYITANHTCE